MENFNSVSLDKSMYSTSNKSFTSLLEEKDPSNRYKGTIYESLDPFERQLKRYNIKVSGRESDVVGKFFSQTGSSILFPEFVNRSIKIGMEEKNILDDIVATTTKIDGLDYRSITSNPSDEDKKPAVIAAGAKIPETIIKTKSNLVKLNKRGRILIAPYEIIKYQRLDLFSVTLKQIGAAIAKAQVKDAIEILLNGDGNNNPADIINVKTAGTINYEDLLNLWATFEDSEMNTMVASPSTILKLAALEEFKNPLAGINFLQTGKLQTPLGANLIKTKAIEDGLIIGLDKTCALEKVDVGSVFIEYDKLIDRQLERATITATSGFTKIFNDAVKVLKI